MTAGIMLSDNPTNQQLGASKNAMTVEQSKNSAS